MLNILTDSTSDLSADIISEFNIKVVPLSVSIGNEV
jgi:fatty acid-binding protein DegV